MAAVYILQAKDKVAQLMKYSDSNVDNAFHITVTCCTLPNVYQDIDEKFCLKLAQDTASL